MDWTLFTVVLGAGAIGAISGGLGTFAYLRRQGLVGDIVSHSALFGVVLAFVLSWVVTGTGSRSLVVLVPGAAVAGLAALLLARLVERTTRIKEDASLGVALALFFGGGLFLLRWIQRGESPIRGHAGLDDYIFGMAAAMTRTDLAMIGALAVVAIVVLVLGWNRFRIYTFDPEFARSAGMHTAAVEALLLGLFVLGIVIGIQAVGVVLMISLLITPAAAARQWSGSVGVMLAIAASIGGASGVVGALVSATELRVPTGPVVVLATTIAFAVSLFVAPKRGVLARARARRASAEVPA